MNVTFAEAVNTELIENIDGFNLCHARILDMDSNKYKIINQLFENTSIVYFLRLADYINRYLKIQLPLVVVTDWTDPTEMVGLRLESETGVKDYPNRHFLAFNTDWDDINRSGIEVIFAHEISHLWLSLLGYDIKLSRSNKFHTCTAITDPFMAFSEGFAEHFEIVTKELSANVISKNAIWDHGYDVNAWLCLRDEQLRYHAVINNRFIYHTALPVIEDYESYNQLHLAHITSSAFTPEKLKTGNQMMASEGVVSAIFYNMYQHEMFKNEFLDDVFYLQFGVEKNDLDPNINLYLKIIFAMSKMDLRSATLMTDFITSYAGEYTSEKRDLFEIFLKVTHYATVSHELPHDFGKLYGIGRSGDVKVFRDTLKKTTESKQAYFNQVLKGELTLDHALVNELWIEGDEKVTPVPWEPDKKSNYYFDINTATEIDFLSLRDVTLEDAKKIVKARNANLGFISLDEFYKLLNENKPMLNT